MSRHPFKLTQLRKHNPLQRLAYLGIMLFVGPLIWVTGVLYLFYDKWPAWAWATCRWNGWPTVISPAPS